MSSRLGPAYRTSTLRRVLVACALLLGLGQAPTARGAEQASEYQLKAAFLFHFTSFIEWPERAFAGPDAPFRLCLVGGDPFGAAIKSLESKTYRGRRIVVEALGGEIAAGHCQIVYFNGRVPAEMRALAQEGAGQAVLTVSSEDAFTEQGGMIQFVPVEGRVRIQVNLAAARAANLRVSAKLLEVAVKVIDSNAGQARS